MRLKEITTGEWEEQFKPITNHLDSNASWQDDDGNGIMFETYGEELDFVKTKLKENPNCIWTLVDSDDGEECIIVGGYHFVNRIGYFITEVPAEKDFCYNVKDCDTLHYEL
jgi:hypothetical protein